MRCFRSALLIVLFISLVACAGSKRDPVQSKAMFDLGISNMRSGNNNKAFVKFHEALRFDDENAEALNGLGVIHLNLAEMDKAMDYFNQAILIKPDFSEAYNNLCYVYYKTEDYTMAIASCKLAIENPFYTTPEKSLYNIGRSYYKMGKYDESIKYMEKAVKRFPNFFQGYYALALSYNAAKLYPSASKNIGLAIGFDPRFLGNALRAEEKFMKLRHTSPDAKLYEEFIEILHY
jgi:tetratricopeptide (TPR) repeat protein